MRGKVLGDLGHVIAIGITPAYAGKSGFMHSSPAGPWDHPRVCGEKSTTLVDGEGNVGSPPRMRGKVFAAGVCRIIAGITPAYAGKSEHWKRHRPFGKDHPRVCGEKPITIESGSIHEGSPPRMRGKAVQLQRADLPPGITPAYAGKRPSMTWPGTWPRDHPRVCGEKSPLSKESVLEWGSPPRMRGKVRSKRYFRSGYRITPAYAGKSERARDDRRPG